MLLTEYRCKDENTPWPAATSVLTNSTYKSTDVVLAWTGYFNGGVAEGWGDMVRVMPRLVIHVMGKIGLQAGRGNERNRGAHKKLNNRVTQGKTNKENK